MPLNAEDRSWIRYALQQGINSHEKHLHCDAKSEPEPAKLVIPPLPLHYRFSRFRTNAGKALDFEDGLWFFCAPYAWKAIENLNTYELEACCCIARCWWIDNAAEETNLEAQRGILAIAAAWTEYLQARSR